MNKTTQTGILAAMVSTLFAASPAHAADTSWTPHFYIGIHAGSTDGDGTEYDAVGYRYSVGSPNGDTTRSNIGVLGGINFRNGPWLLGIEADYGYMSEDAIDNGSCHTYSIALCETKYNYHLRARAGYAVTKNVDLFLAAGYAGINARMYNLSNNYEKTMHGYSIGAGADISLMQNGVLRLEVLHDKYDGKEFGPADYGISDWEDLTIRAAAIFTF